MLDLDANTFQSMLGEATPLLVDFWAPWCMPCKIFAPALEELDSELDGKVSFAKLNIDDYPDIATRYGISSIPTVILFKGGNPVVQMVGVRSKENVRETLAPHI